MLKNIIDMKIRLDLSMDKLAQRMNEKSEDGFASAETIALAVAGVLIVGGVYGIFRGKVNDAITKLFEGINLWS